MAEVKEFLLGERFGAPLPPEKEGYTFSGWFTSSDLDEAYNFAKYETGDIKLYAAFLLSAPEFSISSLSFVYDEKVRYLGFDKLSHPLDKNGTYSYVWYKNSEPTSYSSSDIQIRSVSDSGEYFCKLTFAYDGDFVEILTPTVRVSVEKREIEVPKFENIEYTGERIYPEITTSYLWSYETEGGINAGKYQIRLTITDPINNKWVGTDSESIGAFFEIIKAKNAFVGEYDISGSYVGNPISVRAEVKFGKAECFWSDDGFVYTDKLPTLPGKYYVQLRVAETENYTALSSLPKVIELLEEKAVGIKLEKPPLKTQYRVFDFIDLSGAEFSVTYNSGRCENLSADAVKTVYRSGDCFLAQDSYALAEYAGVSVPIPVVISAAEYDLSGIVFDDKTVVYNGKHHSIDAVCELKGKDGVPLLYTVVGGGTDAGVYTVRLEFSTESINYATPEPITAILTISPMPITVEYGDTEFVYDGTPKLPSVKMINADGVPLSPTVSGGATDAGVYVATVTVLDKNYTIINPTSEYRILRADIDLSGASWSGESFTYSGSPYTVYLIGLPKYVSIIGYANASFTDAGEYRAEVKLAYDEKNYNPPEPVYHVWSIKPASYDMSGVSFPEQSFVYDGSVHYPIPRGDMPKGHDGSSPEYVFSAGATHVSEGRVSVTVNYLSKSKNYLAPESTVTYVTVTPKSISVIWGINEFVYDGIPHLPSASAEECDIRISGAGIDAGEYTATAEAVNSDYSVSDSSCTYVIKKAKNSWKSLPSASDIYEGDAIEYTAEAVFGNIEVYYYSDSGLKNPIAEPSVPGVYYLVYSVPESKNYLSMSSSALKFSIIKVEPIALNVDILTELVAMNRISDSDIRAVLKNNNGSESRLSVSDLVIGYQTSDRLLVSHTEISFVYGKFSIKLPISVALAEYDMSGTAWVGTVHVYDGSEKYAELVGLPEGVTVLSYIVNSATNAGRYTLSATLDYDSENYIAPIQPSAELVIEKQVIKLPKIASAVYDGAYHEANIEPSVIYTHQSGGGILPGKYNVVFILNDPDNYEFSNGVSELSFEILKRPITVTVGEDGKSYTVSEGSLVSGDALAEEYYTENGFIYLRSENQNYDITVLPFERGRGENSLLVLLIVISIFAMMLGTYIFLMRRNSLPLAANYAVKKTEQAPKTEKRTKSEGKSIPVLTLRESSAPLQTLMAVDEAHANSLISDALAKSLLTESEPVIETDGTGRTIVNIERISDNFAAGATVDINAMKEKGIIRSDARYVKVLAGGVIDKPLTVIANAFSLSAIKMIALTGGSAKHAKTVRRRTENLVAKEKADENKHSEDISEEKSKIFLQESEKVESTNTEISSDITKSDKEPPKDGKKQ